MTSHVARLKYWVWISLISILFPMSSYAPCVLFMPPDQQLDSTAQRAFFSYNPQMQQVYLVPSINFKGDATDFAVVIPTPSVPKLDTVDRQIFRELDTLTSPTTRWRGGSSSGCRVFQATDDDDDDDESFATADGGVTVISEQRVGAFDTVILTADNPTALTDWLDEHDYNHSIEDDDILQSYIDQKWIFTAMRLNVEQQGDGRFRGQPFFNGTIDPILMTYSSNSLIYPLRLTSISAREGVDVIVYILSDDKMDFPSARVEYANSITDNERDAIRQRHPTFGSFIGEQRYLTRLRRSFARTEMNADFEIVRHADNREFRRVRYLQTINLVDYLLFVMITIGYFALRRIRPSKQT